MRFWPTCCRQRARAEYRLAEMLSPVHAPRRLQRRIGRFALWQQSGDPCPFVADADRLAQRFDEFGLRVVVPPAPGIVELDDMGRATLREGDPFARHAVERTGITCG